MKKILRSNLFFLILILLQLFGGFIILPIKMILHISKISELLLLTQILFLIIPVIVYVIVTRQSFVKVLRIKKLSLENIGYIIIISILAIPIMSLLGEITNLFFHNNVNDLMVQMKNLPLWQMVAVVAMLPACCEELTMRGVVLSGFEEMTTAKAAVLSGFLFAVLHLNPPQFLYAFALGIILAYLVNITHSIFASMIVHFIFNANSAVLTWISLRMKVKTQDITSMPQSDMIFSLIFYAVISIICVYWIYSLIKKLEKLNKREMKQVRSRACSGINSKNSISSLLAYSPVAVCVLLYIMYVSKIRFGHIQSSVFLGFICLYFIYGLVKIRKADEC